MLAPVVLFTYNRYKHTKSTIEALGKNPLARKSDLYIFVDYIDDEQKRVQCQPLYTFLDDEAWKNKFKQVNITYAKSHKGLANSVINGVSQIMNKYGKVIVLEDDIVTIPSFLQFMNECLDYYEDDLRVWSISGYAFPCDLLYQQKEELYLGYRASSWGWATWKNRWDLVDWQVTDYRTFKYNVFKRALFNRGGCDASFMLDRQMNGEIDSWAIRWCYSQYRQKMYTVYPTQTFVKNNGMDGSGTHFVSEGGSIAPTNDSNMQEIANANTGYKLKKLYKDRKTLRIVYRFVSGNVFQRTKKHFIVLTYHMGVLNYFLKAKKKYKTRPR